MRRAAFGAGVQPLGEVSQPGAGEGGEDTWRAREILLLTFPLWANRGQK